MTTSDERGSAAVELTLLTPLLLLLLLLVVAFGRIGSARSEVNATARDAARAASIERNSSSAEFAARSTAEAGLQTGRVSCRSNEIRVDTSSFRAGGWVAVEVTCHTDLSDLSLLRLPGSRAIQARFVEPVDTYAERGM